MRRFVSLSFVLAVMVNVGVAQQPPQPPETPQKELKSFREKASYSVGFTIGGIWPIRASAFAIFLAWAFKFTLLKLGGISLYRRAQPFVLGMLVGYVLGVVMGFVVDAVWFPGQGHVIHAW